MRKNTLNSYKILSAGDMSGNLVSKITCIQFMDNIGIQINITSGTPTGTLAVQVSADHQTSGPTNDIIVAGNWVTLTSLSVASGQPSNIYFDLKELSAPFIQLIYTAGSGSGTCDAFIVGKSI